MSNIIVTQEMIDAGSKMADYLIDALLDKTLGSEDTLDLTKYPEEYRDYISEYTDTAQDSVKAIYAAMEMERINE